VRTGAPRTPHPAIGVPQNRARAGRSKVAPRSTLKAAELRTLAEHFRAVPDDRCRLRERHGVHLSGACTRWANSRFIHWRQQQPNGRHLTATDQLGHFAEDDERRAIRALTAKRFPS
jgi:hypothetical protein